jgi:hypothetical protein
MWARMLANGMDPERRNILRQSIIKTVKSFDPIDAVVLQKAFKLNSDKNRPMRLPKEFSQELDISLDELELSLINLFRLGCISHASRLEHIDASSSFIITSLGREIIRATSL